MENNNGIMKGMLIMLLVIYVISPLDLCPGVVDDLLLVLLTAASNMKKTGKGRELPGDALEGEWRER